MNAKESLFLITIFFAMNENLFSKGDDPQYATILAHLSNRIEVLNPNAIGGLITVEEVWKEFNDDKQESLLLLNNLAKNGRFDAKHLVVGHEQGWQAWKRRCLVLIDQLKSPGAELRRFNEESGSAGYVVVINGTPKYWLHIQSKVKPGIRASLKRDGLKGSDGPEIT
jgi:hypothetical protein